MKWEIKHVGFKGDVAAQLHAQTWPGHPTDEAGKRAFEWAKGAAIALLVGFPPETTHARINVQGKGGVITQVLVLALVEPPAPPPINPPDIPVEVEEPKDA